MKIISILKRYFIISILLALTLISCDPGIGVAISNKSGVDRNIRVIYPENFQFPSNTKEHTNDSLQTYDHTLTGNRNSGDYYNYPGKTPILSSDTVNRSYSFKLKDKHEVIVERRWPASLPTFGQMFIIDNTDTVKLLRRGKDFKKRAKLLLGGTWTHTIAERK
jgi:hypothetical protein